MTDIIERLRKMGSEESLRWSLLDLSNEAADELARLRALLEAKTTPGYELLATTIEKLEADNERLQANANRPWLGLATTRELLDELRTRIEMHALGGLDYRTVDGEEIARAALEPKP